MIQVHLVHDVKQDGMCKAILVAGGQMTGPNTNTYYSSVVSLRTMRMIIFLAELNGMELIAADIGNAYLEAYTDQKICFIASKKPQGYGHEGPLMLIVKGLYGLQGPLGVCLYIFRRFVICCMQWESIYDELHELKHQLKGSYRAKVYVDLGSLNLCEEDAG
eukprot:3138162-Ditylum_brightwellii.AAC.1